MRSLPLTKGTRPGGRPRQTRAPRNPFADWLAASALKPADIAKALGVSVSSVYNSRNSYFRPGLELALAIEKLTEGAVPVGAWPKAKQRKRKAA